MNDDETALPYIRVGHTRLSVRHAPQRALPVKSMLLLMHVIQRFLPPHLDLPALINYLTSPSLLLP